MARFVARSPCSGFAGRLTSTSAAAGSGSSGSAPVAIAVELLRRQRVFVFDAGGRGFVVVTSPKGASRLYERGAFTFDPRDSSGLVRDREGKQWMPTSEALVRETGERLPRVAAHRAFWFGWHAQHPDTVLYR
jgi:hypothetical protein